MRWGPTYIEHLVKCLLLEQLLVGKTHLASEIVLSSLCLERGEVKFEGAESLALEVELLVLGEDDLHELLHVQVRSDVRRRSLQPNWLSSGEHREPWNLERGEGACLERWE